MSDNPRQLSELLDRILKEFGISICTCTLRNILKSLGYRWRRIRKSLKSKRDEEAFIRFQKRLNRWQKQADQGKLNLYYFDEAGFSLTPSVCYAWQKTGTQIQLFAQRGSNYTILGFMNKQLDFHPYIKEGSANSDDVIYCIDQFCEDIRKNNPINCKSILVLDNAPTHTSRKFKNRIRHWNSLGLRVEFLPKYSPELNLIEILWRFVKYKWLPFKAYSSKQSLVNELGFILNHVGSKYRINFS